MSIPKTTLENWFRCHAATPDQIDRYGAIRAAAHQFAALLNDLVPDGADKSAALRQLRESVMTANAAIACHEAAAEVASTRPPLPVVALSRNVGARSSNIEAISWEGTSATPEATGLLVVRYKSSGPDGGAYVYEPVPRSVYEAALIAESIGSFVSREVVKNASYRFRKVLDVEGPGEVAR